MVTPVDAQGNIDTAAVGRIIGTFCDNGLHPLLLGTTGEGTSVSGDKGEVLVADWEFGGGLFYKYQMAPMAMLTASGSIIDGKVQVVGEGDDWYRVSLVERGQTTYRHVKVSIAGSNILIDDVR